MQPGSAFHTREQHGRLWRLYVMIGTSLLLITAAAYYLNATVRDKDWLRFQSLTQRMQHDIESHVETYIALLRASAGFFAATEAVDQDRFHAFVDQLDLHRHYPGLPVIGFSRHIRPEEKAAIVAAMQQEKHNVFHIWPEYESPEYHAVLYLEPLDQHNQAAIGFDMFTEPVRRAAMERARDTGLPAASAKVTLI